MGKATGISWTDATWNPWQGCHPVSEGCANCYMYREKRHYGQDPTVVVRSSASTFRAPRRWKEPTVVFVCSWSDFLIEEADPWRAEAWQIMRETPRHTYLLLTKRIERARECLPRDWPLENVWLGVTAENQARAEERIPQLLAIPAVGRFVSVEPMLGWVWLERYLPQPLYVCQRCGEDFSQGEADHNRRHAYCGGEGDPIGQTEGLEWVIVGGESGPSDQRRRMDVEWALALHTECQRRGVPFFGKQLSGPKDPLLIDGEEVKEWPNNLRKW